MSGERWMETGWFLSPSTVGALMTDIGSVGAYSERANIAWRGMRSIDYDFLSSLQRSAPHDDESLLRQREVELLREARHWGLGYGVGGWSSDLQLLADLQHYGTSTRLIDVTSDPMTALWFAAQDVGDSDVSRSGVIVAIDTAAWPRFGRSQPHGSWASARNPLGSELEAGIASGAPFVVESLHPNDRLRAQNGYFVASQIPAKTPRNTPFTGLSIDFPYVEPSYARQLLDDMIHNQRHVTRMPIPFIAVKVKSHLKPRIRRILENSYNRSARVLFPDFAGFRDFSSTATPRTSEEEIDAKRSVR